MTAPAFTRVETTHSPRIEQTWKILRIAFGLLPLLAGLDKFFNLLTNWTMYVSPLAARLLPITPPTLMRAVGVIEMAVGVMILTRWPRLGSYIAAVWLMAIAANVIIAGNYYDVAVRDVELAFTAYVLARLTEVVGSADQVV